MGENEIEKTNLVNDQDKSKAEQDFNEEEFRKEQDKRISKLSEIIKGAPNEILPVKKEEIPDFFYHGTEKVSDILYSRRASKETIQTLKETFKNKTVIDIGAGEGIYGLSQLTDRMGVKNYIAVEPAFYESCVRSINPDKDAYKSVEKIHISKADMLAFARSLPDKCEDIVILMSGIDYIILNLETPWANEKQRKNSELAKQYLKDFWSEIRRVLVPGNGRVVTYASVWPPEEGFKHIHEGEGGAEGSVKIFERSEDVIEIKSNA